jgi:hypothetical protein
VVVKGRALCLARQHVPCTQLPACIARARAYGRSPALHVCMLAGGICAGQACVHTSEFQHVVPCARLRSEKPEPPAPGEIADVPLYVAAYLDTLTIYRDMSGHSLHRCGRSTNHTSSHSSCG